MEAAGENLKGAEVDAAAKAMGIDAGSLQQEAPAIGPTGVVDN